MKEEEKQPEKQPEPYAEQKHIEALVLAFQAGEKEAGEELLRIYGGHPDDGVMTKYLGKYFRMLRFGKIDFKDYDSRAFMRAFLGDTSIGDQLLQSYQYKATKEEVLRMLQGVSDSLKVLDDEELRQELRFLFLRQVKRYKQTNRTFGGYIYNSYRFAVKNHIKAMMKPLEPYMHKAKDLVPIVEERALDPQTKVEVTDAVFERVLMVEIGEELGNSWVRGITCGDEFKDLNPLQRLIIKLNYFDGLTDGEISQKMGVHINTIFRQRKKANDIVKATVERMKDKGLDG